MEETTNVADTNKEILHINSPHSQGLLSMTCNGQKNKDRGNDAVGKSYITSVEIMCKIITITKNIETFAKAITHSNKVMTEYNDIFLVRVRNVDKTLPKIGNSLDRELK